MSSNHHSGGRNTLVFLCCLLAMPTATMLLPGIVTDSLEHAVLAGALLGFAHLLIRPILRFISAPIGCLTLGLFGFVLDVGLLYGCAYLVPDFAIVNVWHAVLSAILVNATCLIAAGRR